MKFRELRERLLQAPLDRLPGPEAQARLATRPREVARILEVPVRDLLDLGRLHVEPRTLGGVNRRVPYFDLEGEKVWGATAMVLSELIALLGEPRDPWR